MLRPLFPVCCGCSMCFPSEESLVTHPQWQRPECHCDMERRDLRDGHSLARHKEAKEGARARAEGSSRDGFWHGVRGGAMIVFACEMCLFHFYYRRAPCCILYGTVM